MNKFLEGIQLQSEVMRTHRSFSLFLEHVGLFQLKPIGELLIQATNLFISVYHKSKRIADPLKMIC